MLHVAYPFLILAAPAVIAFILLISRRDHDVSRARAAAAMATRSLGVLALVVAMAGPSTLRTAVQPPRVIFALDVSESVDDDALDEAIRTIEATSAAVSALGGTTGLVAFAGKPSVLRAPTPGPITFQGVIRERVYWRRSEAAMRTAAERGEAGAADRLATLSAWRESIEVLATRLGPATLAAESLHQADADNSTIVISDGRESRGAISRDDGRISWIRLPADRRRDLVVRNVTCPTAVRHGEPFEILVEVEASHAGELTLALTVDDLVQTTAVERFRLHGPGRYTFPLSAPQSFRALEPGLHRLMAMALQEGEAERRNNHSVAGVTIVGKPEALLVESTPVDGEALARILTVQQIGFRRVPASQLPSMTDGLDRFATVILAGVAPNSLSRGDASAIREFVENGGGLLVVASSAWLKTTDFARSEIADLLPVEWIPTKSDDTAKPSPPTPTPVPPRPGSAEAKRVLAPSIALLLAIDKSGSMASAAGNGYRNIDLAREACIAAAETLTEHDYVAVLPFDGVAHVNTVKWSRADSLDFFKKDMLRLQADGGTKIHRALEALQSSFARDPHAAAAGVKHVILLSDGLTPPADFESLIAPLVKDGITLTTVCVGTGDFDPIVMKQLANLGKGRFLFTGDFHRVPKIFTAEANLIVKDTARAAHANSPPLPAPLVPNGTPPVAPSPTPTTERSALVLKDAHEVTKGVQAPLPGLGGVVGTRERARVSVPLATSSGQPVLAIWRRGLGKSAVWTADVGGPWSAEWSGWQSTPRLFAQLVRHLSSAAEDGDLASRVTLSRDGDAVTVRVESGSAPENLALHVLSPNREEIALVAGPDGSRVARMSLDTPGVLHTLSLVRGGDREERVPLLAMLPYQTELAPGAAERPFDRVTSVPRSLSELERAMPSLPAKREARTDLALWCLLAAALLLPVDVALRRIR